MMQELENEDFDSDEEEIFDDEEHIDMIELDFPEENYEKNFALWEKKEKLKALKRIYDDL